MIFVKISQYFNQISLKSLVYLTDFSPQFMACIQLANVGSLNMRYSLNIENQLRNEFHFSKIHEVMDAICSVQSD